jgi:5-hydroxyisourate hydrolase-like protein (transthyretin family)
MSQIISGDNGTQLEFTVFDDNGVVDLSSAKEVKFRLKKLGNYIEKIANVTSAADGKCTIALNQEDTNRRGSYSYQLTVTFIDNSVFSSEIKRLTIEDKL